KAKHKQVLELIERTRGRVFKKMT
ncbi:hypothetical protein BCLUESOX_761, partial [bacterium endosymbiont of Bathymodiolus sp. 5 South]